MRTATLQDFQLGKELFTSEGYSFVLKEKYGEGIWNALGCQGQGWKVIYEDEAAHYTVKTTS